MTLEIKQRKRAMVQKVKKAKTYNYLVVSNKKLFELEEMSKIGYYMLKANGRSIRILKTRKMQTFMVITL